jgi:diguanylate cyclase (GGDEF)-like protein
MSPLSADRLLAIVLFQTEIAKARMDLGEVITRASELSQTLTNADGGAVELAEGDEMVYRAASGIAAAQLGLRIPRATSLSGLCVDQGTPLSCEDSETDSRVNAAACRAVGLRSMFVVPLKHEDITVGVLKVMSSRPDAFSADDMQALSLMSEIIAASMAHATQHASKVEEVEALYRQATRDSLTGLANRALFYDQLRQGLALARRQKRAMAIAMLDMDGLKQINDGHGHRAGDAALRALAARLRKATRSSDTVARLGGDEFAIVLATVVDRDAAREVGEKITKQVEGPFDFEGRAYPLGASLGLAVFPDEGIDTEALIGLADERMYAAKRARKGVPGR